MGERPQAARGLLDTSVVIDIEKLDPSNLPIEAAVSAFTMAELAAGPHATSDADERARRPDRFQRAEAAFDPLPFVDLLIAATALAARIPLYTRNGDDFRALEGIVDIVEV